ncbi:Homeobox-leucine zipper protein HOX27 [Hibiscus syriacus]|uniref:Homeobox-leucine zipper protein HOX27 n=1 Tax=Hibiscus syriacus TaxID=106335 RepID=A0A6A3CS69_HIBSY|nr:homeobox-leucine zipper protein HAT22-like [Hibiscus syriacus]KAE8731304.1 Homeobox-leucine zipper protein HOX27 [Hibiscus syriacus]
MGFDDICSTGLGLGLSLGLGCLVKQETFPHRRKKKKSWMANGLFCPSLTLGSSDDASKAHANDELIDLHRQASSVTVASSFPDSGVKKESGFGGGAEVEFEKVSSRVSDEDDEGSHRKKLRLSKRQSAILEDSFKEHTTLNPKKKQALADQLNLRPRQVEVWFQNRRARTKLKQTEVDCELLKRSCETLTEENKSLHKELQELKLWKQTASYCMQPPAAAVLTVCPSCERVANGGEDASGFKIRTKAHLFTHPSAACS